MYRASPGCQTRTLVLVGPSCQDCDHVELTAKTTAGTADTVGGVDQTVTAVGYAVSGGTGAVVVTDTAQAQWRQRLMVEPP